MFFSLIIPLLVFFNVQTFAQEYYSYDWRQSPQSIPSTVCKEHNRPFALAFRENPDVLHVFYHDQDINVVRLPNRGRPEISHFKITSVTKAPYNNSVAVILDDNFSAKYFKSQTELAYHDLNGAFVRTEKVQDFLPISKFTKIAAATRITPLTTSAYLMYGEKDRGLPGHPPSVRWNQFVASKDPQNNQHISDGKMIRTHSPNEPLPTTISYSGKVGDKYRFMVVYKKIYAEFLRAENEFVNAMDLKQSAEWHATDEFFGCPPVLCLDSDIDAADMNFASKRATIVSGMYQWTASTAHEFRSISEATPTKRTDRLNAMVSLPTKELITFDDTSVSINGGQTRPIKELFGLDVVHAALWEDNKLVLFSNNRYSTFNWTNVTDGDSKPVVVDRDLRTISKWKGLPPLIDAAMVTPTREERRWFFAKNFIFLVENYVVPFRFLIQSQMACSGDDTFYKNYLRDLKILNWSQFKSYRDHFEPAAEFDDTDGQTAGDTTTLPTSATKVGDKATENPEIISPTKGSSNKPIPSKGNEILYGSIAFAVIMSVIIISGIVWYFTRTKKPKSPIRTLEPIIVTKPAEPDNAVVKKSSSQNKFDIVGVNANDVSYHSKGSLEED